MKKMARIIRHLSTTAWQVRRTLPSSTLRVIEMAVGEAEQGHSGEIRVVIEGSLSIDSLWRNFSSRERATDIFSHLRIWDTEQNNGVLLYLLMADHSVEVVADRGIAKHVPTKEWEDVCEQMRPFFRAQQFEKGVIFGVQAIAEKLRKFFPDDREPNNELPDTPAII